MSESKPSVVFVVAHPDDVAFGMGGTAVLLMDRYQLHVLCASRGERGYKWDGQGLAPPSDELGETREAEERAACARIDASVTFLGQTDGEIYADREICQRVAEAISKIKPVAVFTLEALGKPDHASACLIARQAMHLSKRYWETELYMVARDGETRNPQDANIFVDITGVVEAKKEQMFCHKTQLPKPDSWKKKLDRDRVMGVLAGDGCEFAEAYCTEHPLSATRWGRKSGSILMDLGG